VDTPAHHRSYAGPVPSGAPAAAVVHAIHDRYLYEIVEDLGVCPFARRCRQLGRLHRLPFVADRDGPTPDAVARHLGALLDAHDDAEIVLLTFVPVRGHRFWDPGAFEDFTRAVRAAYEARRTHARGLPRLYAVSFHPDPPKPAHRPTPENLVPTLRRTPDPVIQCVRADMLDALRAESSRSARARLEREMARIDPALAARLRHAILTDPALSSEIAERNFAAVGAGPARQALEDRLARFFEERRRAYPAAFAPPAPPAQTPAAL